MKRYLTRGMIPAMSVLFPSNHWREKLVSTNLKAVLRVLRLPEAPRILWIDALCICFDRREHNHRRNVRLGLPFSEGFHLLQVQSD
jgi:hypothetical protein